MAALDREERAVEAYAGLVRRAGRLALSRHGPAEPLGGVGSCTGPACAQTGRRRVDAGKLDWGAYAAASAGAGTTGAGARYCLGSTSPLS